MGKGEHEGEGKLKKALPMEKEARELEEQQLAASQTFTLIQGVWLGVGEGEGRRCFGQQGEGTQLEAHLQVKYFD